MTLHLPPFADFMIFYWLLLRQGKFKLVPYLEYIFGFLWILFLYTVGKNWDKLSWQLSKTDNSGWVTSTLNVKLKAMFFSAQIYSLFLWLIVSFGTMKRWQGRVWGTNAVCSDAQLHAPLGLHRDLVFPGNSKVRPGLTNLHSARLLDLRKYQWAFMQKKIVSAQLSMAAEWRGWRRIEGKMGWEAGRWVQIKE